MNVHPEINDENIDHEEEHIDIQHLIEPLVPAADAAIEAVAPPIIPPRPAAPMRKLFLCNAEEIRNGNFESSIAPLK
jgi:hypothetical protein